MPGNLNDNVKTVKGIAPQAASTAVNGNGIDRSGYNYAVVACETGATTGTPTSTSVAFKVQDSADNTTFADVSSATVTIADAAHGEVNVDLRGLRQYIRVVATPTFVGGTSPTVQISASVVLGDAVVRPAN